MFSFCLWYLHILIVLRAVGRHFVRCIATLHHSHGNRSSDLDFVMNSNTTISAQNGVPGDLALFLNTNNIVDPDVNVDLDYVDFDSNAVLYGTVYAPNAHVEINSNFELYGSLVGKSVHLDSNSYVHFDEALMDAGDGAAGADYLRVSWRERPVSGSEIAW